MPLLEQTHNSAFHITKALRIILRPLINLLIDNGITYPVLSGLLKQMYVETAKTDFKLAGKTQSDSRLNFLTGIHRKDIKRLKTISVDEDAYSESASLSALLMAHWLANPRYLDKQGQPLALPKSIKKGGETSFEGLVASTNNDIRSRVILDQWLHLNIVNINDNDEVCLNQKAFIPEHDLEQKAWFFGENLRDHIAVAVHNLNNQKPPLLERAVYYDQLSSESIKELATLAEKLGMQTLVTLNNQALELQNQDKNKQNASQRMRLGFYYYQSNSDQTTPDTQA